MRVFVLALLLAFSSAAAAQSTRHVLPGDDVAVYDLVGVVRIVAGTGAQVVAEVTRTGPDASQLTVETGRIGSRETLRVIFPADRISYRGLGRWWGTSSVHVRGDGTFGDGSSRGGRRVTISERGSGLNAAADITLQVPAGKRIAVYIGAGEASARNVDGDIIIDAASANVTTESTRGRLRLDTGSGEVSVTDAQGDVSLDTGSGEVTLTRIRADRVVVDAGSGGLRADDVEANTFNADLGSGGTRIMRLKSRNVIVDSGSGSVDIEFLTDVENVVIDAGSGGVTLRVPATLGATLEIETGSGGIDTDFPLTITSRSRTHLRATIGDGRGRISIDTGSGGVRLRRS